MTKDINDSFGYHRGRNDISIDQHISDKQIELANKISDKRSIYLDIKYWIILCEASLKRSKSDLDYDLLELVARLVEEELVFFPISESIYAELMKQDDPLTRLETARLIDKFSTGVALIPYEMRVGTEIAHVMHQSIDPDKIHPLRMMVWTKVSNVLGAFIPSNTVFDVQTELVVQKAFFDHLWNYSLFDMLAKFESGVNHPVPNFESLAENLNRNNEKHSAELRSYEQTYLNEIAGAVELYSDVARDVINKMAERQGIPGEGELEAGRKIMNIFREAYRKGTINESAPTLDIHARCHASVRWNKGRKIEANDIFDFNHAAAALGYTSAFFTERSLCNLLTEKKIALDNIHNCTVLYKVKDSLEYLQAFNN